MNTATAQAVLDAIEACKGIMADLEAAERVKRQALRKWRLTLTRGDRVWAAGGAFVIGDIITDPVQIAAIVNLKFHPHKNEVDRAFVPDGKKPEDSELQWDVFPMTPALELKHRLIERLALFHDGNLRSCLYHAPDPAQALAALDAIEKTLEQFDIPGPIDSEC